MFTATVMNRTGVTCGHNILIGDCARIIGWPHCHINVHMYKRGIRRMVNRKRERNGDVEGKRKKEVPKFTSKAAFTNDSCCERKMMCCPGKLSHQIGSCLFIYI